MHFFVFVVLTITVVSASFIIEYHKDELDYDDYDVKETLSEECEPDKRFRKFCNVCLCGSDGKTVYCTDISCTPGHYFENGTLTPGTKICVPGTIEEVTKENCVKCRCNDQGNDRECFYYGACAPPSRILNNKN